MVGYTRLGYRALGGRVGWGDYLLTIRSCSHSCEPGVRPGSSGSGMSWPVCVVYAWARHSPGVGVLGGLEMLRGAPTFGSGGLALGNVGERQPGQLGMVWCAIRGFGRVFQ